MSIFSKQIKYDIDKLIRCNYKGNNTRWIKDGGPGSLYGHFEKPLDPRVMSGFFIKIDNLKEINIMTIEGDGTEYKSVRISESRYTGKLNGIYDISEKFEIAIPFQTFEDNEFLKDYIDADITPLYGSGIDGVLEVREPNTVVNLSLSVHQDIVIKNSYNIQLHQDLDLTTYSTLCIGREIFIHQTQHPEKDIAGNCEFNIIKEIDYENNIIILKFPLRNTYFSNIYNQQYNKVTQITTIMHYRRVYIYDTGSITCESWDGFSNGIVGMRITDRLETHGKIDVVGKGFRGSPVGGLGEFYMGYSGGDNTGCSGSGGSHIFEGINNDSGVFDTLKPMFGGGGSWASSGGHSPSQVPGRNGSGIIFLYCNNILNPNITAQGSDGFSAHEVGAGGCGAGGYINISAYNIQGNGNMTIYGGTSSDRQCKSYHGSGGVFILTHASADYEYSIDSEIVEDGILIFQNLKKKLPFIEYKYNLIDKDENIDSILNLTLDSLQYNDTKAVISFDDMKTWFKYNDNWKPVSLDELDDTANIKPFYRFDNLSDYNSFNKSCWIYLKGFMSSFILESSVLLCNRNDYIIYDSINYQKIYDISNYKDIN